MNRDAYEMSEGSSPSATIKAIKDELKEGEGDKPKLVLPASKLKEIKGSQT